MLCRVPDVQHASSFIDIQLLRVVRGCLINTASVGCAVRGPVPGLQASGAETAVLEAARSVLQRGLLAFKLSCGASLAFPEGRSPRAGSSLPCSRRARRRADPERGEVSADFLLSFAVRKQLSQNRAIGRPGRSSGEMFRSALLSRLLGRF